MSEFEIPDDMRAIADPRELAAELDYTYFLMACQRNIITPEAEADYPHPGPQDFMPAAATDLVRKFVTWYIVDRRHGLLHQAETEVAKAALIDLAFMMTVIPGTSLGQIQTLQERFKGIRERVRELRSGGEGSPAHPDENVAFLGNLIIGDFIDHTEQGIKEAVMRDRSEATFKKLGELLGKDLK